MRRGERAWRGGSWRGLGQERVVVVGAALLMTTHLQGLDRAPFLDALENLGASGLEPEVGLCLQARASARARALQRAFCTT
jgi:hypothetical protein